MTWLGREEVVVRVLQDLAGQVADEVEDAGLGPLVLAERLVVHEQVAEEAVAVDLVDPAGELLGRQRPLLPGAVAEAERDVVAQPVVLQQQLELRRVRRAVDVVGAAVAEDVVGAFASGSRRSPCG